jgi:outer membrane protein, multidrug efflux system
MPVIPAGLPSALLERRPDVTAAQLAMVASNARIGEARALRFPALRLTGAGGVESSDLASLFTWGANTWALGAMLTMPLIDGGRIRNNITRSEAVLEESVGAYRQSVLAAFAEVEDNLVGLHTLDGQARAIDDAVTSSRRSNELAGKLLAAGRTGYLDGFDAQRNLASTQRTAVQLCTTRAVTTVALIRSLGDGW